MSSVNIRVHKCARCSRSFNDVNETTTWIDVNHDECAMQVVTSNVKVLDALLCKWRPKCIDVTRAVEMGWLTKCRASVECLSCVLKNDKQSFHISLCRQLQYLDLSSSNIYSLRFVRSLSLLKTLCVAHTKVSSIRDVQGCPSLNRLYISGTNVQTLDGIQHCQHMRHLYIVDTPLRSLLWIEELQELECDPPEMSHVLKMCVTKQHVRRCRAVRLLQRMSMFLCHRSAIDEMRCRYTVKERNSFSCATRKHQ